MSVTLIPVTQRSAAWFTARLGRLTGSRAHEMCATRPDREAASRRTLRRQLVRERLTGRPQAGGFTNAAMQRGIALEPAALRAYEAHTGLLVRCTGFLADDDAMLGCSLDGHVGAAFEGIVEVKCPASRAHLAALAGAAVPTKWIAQITHNLLVSGAAWCDVVSFDDRFGPGQRVAIRRVLREEVDLAGYAWAARAFLAEVDLAEQAARAGQVAA